MRSDNLHWIAADSVAAVVIPVLQQAARPVVTGELCAVTGIPVAKLTLGMQRMRSLDVVRLTVPLIGQQGYWEMGPMAYKVRISVTGESADDRVNQSWVPVGKWTADIPAISSVFDLGRLS